MSTVSWYREHLVERPSPEKYLWGGGVSLPHYYSPGWICFYDSRCTLLSTTLRKLFCVIKWIWSVLNIFRRPYYLRNSAHCIHYSCTSVPSLIKIYPWTGGSRTLGLPSGCRSVQRVHIRWHRNRDLNCIKTPNSVTIICQGQKITICVTYIDKSLVTKLPRNNNSQCRTSS